MLSIVLKILSILGILLLCLTGLAVLLLCLVLFFPVSYKMTGKKEAGQTSFRVRAFWLFGFLRISYCYPEPGRVVVKILPFTVYESGRETNDEEKESSGGSGDSAKNGKRRKRGSAAESQPGADADHGEASLPGEKQAAASTGGPGADAGQEEAEETGQKQENAGQGTESGQEQDADSKILKIFKKIKYTICGIYDKIKNIWENISYYIELLREEETKQLFSHVMFRLGKIWRNIHPRHIRGNLLFGTGSPDTTGYACGIYGMMSPFLGDKLIATPDFTRAVLEGNLFISGYVTVFTVLWNVMQVLTDKKLKRFNEKMKSGRKKADGR